MCGDTKTFDNFHFCCQIRASMVGINFVRISNEQEIRRIYMEDVCVKTLKRVCACVCWETLKHLIIFISVCPTKASTMGISFVIIFIA